MTLIVLALRTIATVPVMALCFAAGHLTAALLLRLSCTGSGEPAAQPAPTVSQTPGEQMLLALAVLGVCALHALVLVHPIRRSRWTGWRLILAVFALLFGLTTVMPLTEILYFVGLDTELVTRLLVAGLVTAALAAPAMVAVLGRWRRGSNAVAARLPDSRTGWAARLAVLPVVYLMIYLLFGYFIAWQVPAVREYYGGSEPAGFGPHLINLARELPGLYFLQLGRGLMWTLLALPLLMMMGGGRLERAVALGLLFAILMNAQLLIPNPLMPRDVRMVHLVETVPSNFVLGLVVAAVLQRRSAAGRVWAS